MKSMTAQPFQHPAFTFSEIPRGEIMAARWSLTGRTALVTGGTKGIGKAIAEELAQLGASVYVCARSEDELQERLQEWKYAGLPITGSVCDVALYPSCEQLVAQVSKHFDGKLHILVLNAGRGGHIAPILEVPADDMSLTMRTNFESGVHLTRLAHPLLKASGTGSIVFNSSIAGSKVVYPSISTYSCTKAALNQLTQTLAFEWAKDGIRVNTVAPGFIFAGGVASLSDEALDSLRSRIPLRRLGQATEIAAAVAFLCMPCSSYTTGSIMTVDGGMTCHNVPVACPSIETT